jgi:hypothetical protein
VHLDESGVLEENLILGFDCFLLSISLVVHCAVSGNCSDYSSTHILPVLLKAEKHPRLPQCFPWSSNSDYTDSIAN